MKINIQKGLLNEFAPLVAAGARVVAPQLLRRAGVAVGRKTATGSTGRKLATGARKLAKNKKAMSAVGDAAGRGAERIHAKIKAKMGSSKKGLTEGLSALIRKGAIEKGGDGKLTPKTPAGVRQVKSSSVRRNRGHGSYTADEVAIGKKSHSPNLKGTPAQMANAGRDRQGMGMHSQDSKGSYKSRRGVKKVRGSKEMEPGGSGRNYKAIGGKRDRNDKLSAYTMNRSRGFSKKQSQRGTMWSRPGGFGSAEGRYVAVKPKKSGLKKMFARSTKDK